MKEYLVGGYSQSPHIVRERLSSPDASGIVRLIYNHIELEISRWHRQKPLHRDYTYGQLAERFRCSIPTVKRAVAWIRKRGWLRIEQTGRGNRYHLHPLEDKVEPTAVSTPPPGAMYDPVHNPRGITGDPSSVSPVIPLEARANPDNSVPDDTFEIPAPSRKEHLEKRSFGGGVAPGPSRARGATPTPPEASITSQELDELFSNVGAGEAAAPLRGAAPTHVTARMDDITDAIVGTVDSEDQSQNLPEKEKATTQRPAHLTDEKLAHAERIEAGHRKFQADVLALTGRVIEDKPEGYGRDTVVKQGKAQVSAEKVRRREKHAPVHERQLEPVQASP